MVLCEDKVVELQTSHPRDIHTLKPSPPLQAPHPSYPLHQLEWLWTPTPLTLPGRILCTVSVTIPCPRPPTIIIRESELSVTCSALSPQNVTSPSLFYDQSSTSEQRIQNDKTNRYHDNNYDNNHNTDQKLDDVIKKPWSQYQSLLNLEQILRRLYRTSTPPVDMTRTSSKGTGSREEQSTSSVEKISSGGDESTSGQEQRPSSQEGSERGTKDHEAPGGVQQKWMHESLKGMEDITVEKGETTGKQI